MNVKIPNRKDSLVNLSKCKIKGSLQDDLKVYTKFIKYKNTLIKLIFL